MPMYEYRCNECAARFEILRPMTQRADSAPCPNCSSTSSMPLISRVNAGIGSPSGGRDAFESGGGAGGCCGGGGCGCGAN